MKAAVILAAVLISTGSALNAQELSTTVFPSEDELLEALTLGEISFIQFLRLQEISTHGLDSSSQHLLDEIPNLAIFGHHQKQSQTSLQNEQRSGFGAIEHSVDPVLVRLTHRYSQELEENGRGQYRTNAVFYLGSQLKAEFRIHKEYDGQERIVRRSVTYRNATGSIREITAGSFNRRLGLGTLFGYRGTLLEFSDRLDGESVLFPDYGGYNGLYGKFRQSAFEIQTIASQNRDTAFALTSLGAMVSYQRQDVTPTLIIGNNRLKNRRTGSSVNDFSVGLNLNYQYGRGYSELEVSTPAGGRSRPGAVLIEGRHQLTMAQIVYAAWVYSDDFADLTSGSKAAELRRTLQLDEIDFEYSTRRAGQEGGLIKTILALTDAIDLVSSVLLANIDADNYRRELMIALVKDLGNGWELRADHIVKTRNKLDGTGSSNWVSRRSRLEVRFTGNKLNLRSYAAYNSRSERSDYLSLFTRLSYRSDRLGLTELWSNIGRISPQRRQTDYVYFYLKNEQSLMPNLFAGVKLSHSYSRSTADSRLTKVTFELRSQW